MTDWSLVSVLKPPMGAEQRHRNSAPEAGEACGLASVFLGLVLACISVQLKEPS